MGSIAVTGAAGGLGQAVLARAAAAGMRTLALGREVDVRDRARVHEALGDAEAIVHLAASFSADPLDAFEVNVRGTVHVLDAARRRDARVVFASSLAAADPQGPYGLSKRQAEEWCREFAKAHGLTVATLRFPALFGPGARHNSLLQMASSDPIRLTGDGSQMRDFLHVDDAARAILVALGESRSLQSDVGSGEPIAMRDVAAWFGREIVLAPHAPTGPLRAVAAAPTIPWRPERSDRAQLERYVRELARIRY